MAYTRVQDVELEWGQSVAAENVLFVGWQIEKAERLIASKVRDLAARLDDDLITEQDIRFVVAAMVVRVLRNPEGKQAETAGDYSYQLSAGARSGQMYLTADERALLGGRRGAQSLKLDDDALEYPLKRPWPRHDRDPFLWQFATPDCP